MWFVGINPEEDIPDPSLLAKFRTQRLKETTIDKNIPDYKEMVDHNNAKQTMKNYLERVIEDIEESVDLTASVKTVEAIEQAGEIINSPRFIEQKGIRSLTDKDAG